jgi:hypothetical protein
VCCRARDNDLKVRFLIKNARDRFSQQAISAKQKDAGDISHGETS